MAFQQNIDYLSWCYFQLMRRAILLQERRFGDLFCLWIIHSAWWHTSTVVVFSNHRRANVRAKKWVSLVLFLNIGMLQNLKSTRVSCEMKTIPNIFLKALKISVYFSPSCYINLPSPLVVSRILIFTKKKINQQYFFLRISNALLTHHLRHKPSVQVH